MLTDASQSQLEVDQVAAHPMTLDGLRLPRSGWTAVSAALPGHELIMNQVTQICR